MDYIDLLVVAPIAYRGITFKAKGNGLAEEKPGIVPFVTSHIMGRFFVFFTVAFLLFLEPAGGSNPVGPIA